MPVAADHLLRHHAADVFLENREKLVRRMPPLAFCHGVLRLSAGRDPMILAGPHFGGTSDLPDKMGNQPQAPIEIPCWVVWTKVRGGDTGRKAYHA
jgi:hypothetical protein